MTLLSILSYAAIVLATSFLIKKILTKITHSFYNVPNDINKQYFWIETVSKNNQTYHELHYRKMLNDKFINVIHKDVFESMIDATNKGIEISEYHCSHVNINAFNIQHDRTNTSNLIFYNYIII